MIAFRGDPACKDQAIGRLLHPTDDGDLANTRGGELPRCLLGHFSRDPLGDLQEKFGLPLWFWEVIALVCENLPPAQARSWTIAMLNAVPVGARIDPLHDAFISDLLADAECGIARIAAGDHRVKALSDAFVQSIRHRHAHTTRSVRPLSELFAETLDLLHELKNIASIGYIGRRREIGRRYGLIYVLYCLEHAQARNTTGLLQRLIAIHTPTIPAWRAFWIARTRGRTAIVPNFTEGLLQERVSLEADRGRYVQTLAERILAIVRHCFTEADPSQVTSLSR